MRTPPARTVYAAGQPLDPTGLVVTADYTDGVRDEALAEGYGGCSVSGYDPANPGTQAMAASSTVAGTAKTASFRSAS
ncbi:bacterial Ig-like domain-containing protein [Microbispora sp. NPDC004025]